MDMDVKELTKILKNGFKINPDDFDGKNTNKKLRNLILDAQEKVVIILLMQKQRMKSRLRKR